MSEIACFEQFPPIMLPVKALTFVTSSPKPRELTIREELKALAEQGDLTSALIRYQQFKAEEEYHAAPRPIRLRRR